MTMKRLVGVTKATYLWSNVQPIHASRAWHFSTAAENDASATHAPRHRALKSSRVCQNKNPPRMCSFGVYHGGLQCIIIVGSDTSVDKYQPHYDNAGL